MTMKKMISLLLLLSLAAALCVSASAGEAGELAGSWRVCAGAGLDYIDTLVFHQDGTMEAYALIGIYQPTDKGLLLFSGPWEIRDSELTLANGEVFRMEQRKVEDGEDFPVGMSLYSAEPGDTLLYLRREAEGEEGSWAFFVKGYYYPGIPADESIFNLPRELAGERVILDESMADNGRLLLNGAFYSLQCRVLPLPEDMPEKELEGLAADEMLLSDDAETGEMNLYLSEEELIAYPLEDGEALIFTVGEE